jgi:hypothetical protein
LYIDLREIKCLLTEVDLQRIFQHESAYIGPLNTKVHIKGPPALDDPSKPIIQAIECLLVGVRSLKEFADTRLFKTPHTMGDFFKFHAVPNSKLHIVLDSKAHPLFQNQPP